MRASDFAVAMQSFMSAPMVKVCGGETRLNVSEYAPLDAQQRERSEIAHVDDLNLVLRRIGGEHLAAARDAGRPVGEAIAVVVGADDVARPQYRHPARHRALRRLLAQHLERPIGSFVDLLDALVAELAAGEVSSLAMAKLAYAEMLDTYRVVCDRVLQELR